MPWTSRKASSLDLSPVLTLLNVIIERLKHMSSTQDTTSAEITRLKANMSELHTVQATIKAKLDTIGTNTTDEATRAALADINSDFEASLSVLAKAGGIADPNAPAPGTDTVSGGLGSSSLTGAAGNDSITGGAGNDSITGGAGNDTAAGGAGSVQAAAGFQGTGTSSAVLNPPRTV